MATERYAEVTWQGSLLEGSGTIERVGSGAFGPLDVTWTSRAERPDEHTSPEELIAAAHAACFSMALSHELAGAGSAPERLATSATVTFVAGTGITKIALAVRGRVPGFDEDGFRRAAEAAKDACPVSQALAGVGEIAVAATLEA
ncbi:MAG TPA: OsmC family peroxiredoxin [Gaiellaceae bacterium]|nr:OsmC family peroxiredoxin [Gaiellaceae bacterium]